MDKVKTKDGSVTFYNEEFQEHYHSTSGAEEEAIKKFAQPLAPYLKNKNDITLLDVCFGLGYNTAASIDVFSGKYQSITIIALENDLAIIKNMFDIDTSFASYRLLKDAIKELLTLEKKEVTFEYNTTEITIKLLIGDALQTIKQVENVHGVLFDPFSPKKHPALWSKAFLSDIHRAMTPGAALTTYSCARTFRDTLRALDIEVVNGPCVGRKAPSTIGVKKTL